MTNTQPPILKTRPYALNPQPQTLDPKTQTPNPKPSTPHPEPSPLNPIPSAINPQPRTLTPNPNSRAGTAHKRGKRQGLFRSSRRRSPLGAFINPVQSRRLVISTENGSISTIQAASGQPLVRSRFSLELFLQWLQIQNREEHACVNAKI